ncbi:peptidoglycan recognition family protein [Bifidobacterium tissieri]|uniref:peptidoglycan recognition protein family protein n=1 Tax=Bifidobacterium tissieri TaxID=1630162 RepID=UPI00168A855E|nr:peptidoglycan recognition family protein [Bifidobacterium tissieri]
MAYETLTQYTAACYTSGRPYGITSITIHWWDDPSRHPTFEGAISTFTSGSRRTSAHYVAEAGRVACLVDPDDRAWACGDGVGRNSGGNDRSISIECNPRQSDGDYETIGELIRDLRGVYGDLPLYPHRHWTSTDCPGTYDLDRLDRIARGSAPAESAPRPETAAPTVLDVDGSCGPRTIRRWQEVMGTSVDGKISGQLVPDCRTYWRPALVDSCVTYGGTGSELIRRVQEQLRDEGHYHKNIDGLLGPSAIEAMHAHYGIADDAHKPLTSFGPGLVECLQRALNENRF